MRHANEATSTHRGGYSACYMTFLSLLLLAACLIAIDAGELWCCLPTSEAVGQEDLALVHQQLDRPFLIGDFSAFSHVLDGADELERRRLKTSLHGATAMSTCSALSSLDTWQRIETQGERAIWRLEYLGGFGY